MALITWNPNDVATGITLSNGYLNVAATAAGTHKIARAIASYTTGKYYFENVYTKSGPGQFGAGICNATQTLADYLGDTGNNAMGYYDTGNVFINGAVNTTIQTSTSGQTVCMAVDFAAKLVWWRVNSGNWNNNGANDPATGVGGISFSAITGPYFPAISVYQNLATTATGFGYKPFAFTVPSGFSAFSSTDPQLDYWNLRTQRNLSSFDDDYVDDDLGRKSLYQFNQKRRQSFQFGRSGVFASKLTEFDVVTPPDTSLSVSKFTEFDVVTPPDTSLSVSKFVDFIVGELLPSVTLPSQNRYRSNAQADNDDINDYTNLYKSMTSRLRYSLASLDATITLGNVSATGAVGILIPAYNTNITLTGVNSNANVGNITVAYDSNVSVIGVSATADVGELIASYVVDIIGVAANAAVGTLTIESGPGLAGVYSNAVVGTLGVQIEGGSALTGIYGTGAVGNLLVITGPNTTDINITGVRANAVVGTTSIAIDAQLTGVASIANVGNLSVLISQPGFYANKLVASTAATSVDDIGISMRYSDTAGASWGSSVTQSFATTGDYLKNVSFRRIGYARNRVFEISWSAPTKTAVTGIFVKYEKGTS